MLYFAPHVLHHNALSSYMAHLPARTHVRGAGTPGADGASSSLRPHEPSLDQGKPRCI
jgi:hypothetical protein